MQFRTFNSPSILFVQPLKDSSFYAKPKSKGTFGLGFNKLIYVLKRSHNFQVFARFLINKPDLEVCPLLFFVFQHGNVTVSQWETGALPSQGM